MTLSGRRGFLKIAGSLPAASVAPVAVATAFASTSARSGESAELRRSHFEALIGQQFSISIANVFSDSNDSNKGAVSRQPIRLVAVEGLGNRSDQERSFRAVFEAVGAQGVSQSTWSLSHPALGEHLVFLSPNDAAAEQVEAVFMRG